MHAQGLNVDPPVGGRLNVRGHSGHVFRWGEGWLEEIRDQVCWTIQRHGKSQVLVRINLLIALFKRKRAEELMHAIVDGPSLALADVPNSVQ